MLQALKRYMAAEQKDRRHTLRHYQHIVAVDPQKAEQMKFQVGGFRRQCVFLLTDRETQTTVCAEELACMREV